MVAQIVMPVWTRRFTTVITCIPIALTIMAPVHGISHSVRDEGTQCNQ